MVSPRFWLEPKYEALLCDADGLAFELCGSSVKAMTEEDYIAASGNVQHSGKANPVAQKWADPMTEKYPELAVADPIFGQLQNCMELAVVGALVVKDRLTGKGRLRPAHADEFARGEARRVQRAQAGADHCQRAEEGQGSDAGVSGGVAINSWVIADKAKPSDKVAPVRAKSVFQKTAGWWQN